MVDFRSLAWRGRGMDFNGALLFDRKALNSKLTDFSVSLFISSISQNLLCSNHVLSNQLTARQRDM